MSQVNNTAVIFFNRQFLTFSYYFDKVLLCFCKRSKTPSDNTCLGEPPESFYVVSVCCCFASLEVFHSLLCFSASSLTFLEAATGFSHAFYTFSAVHRRVIRNTFILTFLRFSITILLRALQFWAGVFLPTDVFYLALLPHILACFCDSDVGRNTLSRILLCACPHRIVPSCWRIVWNYSYYSCKTIRLSIAPVRHEE